MFVMDLDDAKAKATELGIIPSRPNIRRVVRAHDLVNRGHVRLQADFGDEQVYVVISQNNPSDVYTVLWNGTVKCTCLDYQKHGETCKHGIAALLQEEKDREDAMIAEYETHESNHFACDHELY